MILYIENPKDAVRKLLELINEFGKVAGYKINAQKSLAFLYTNDKKSEREIEETLPFTFATKRIKYLGINLSKETKDLYAENSKTLMKEIKDDTNRWRDIPCSWIGRIQLILHNSRKSTRNLPSLCIQEALLEALFLKAGAQYECHPELSIKPATSWAKVNEPLVLCQVLLQLAGLGLRHSSLAAEQQGPERRVQAVL